MFYVHYGLDYVKDTGIANESKELLETKDWVRSEYGAPGVTITTPIVLERMPVPELPEEQKDKIKIKVFGYTGAETPLDIVVTSQKLNLPKNNEGQQATAEGQNPIDLNVIAEGQLKRLEQMGAANIITRREQFITPNGQEGLKTYGTASFTIAEGQEPEDGNYVHLGFTTQNIVQEILLIWKQDDVYGDQIIERVINSIELITLDQEEEEE